MTLGDVRSKIRLKAELETLHGHQIYQAVATVAEAVFADPKKPKKVRDSEMPQNKGQAIEKFHELFG